MIDGLSRLVMRDCNYATVSRWPRHDPGWFMLEWDIALDRHSRDRFEANALQNPDRVRVAPYMLYPMSGPQNCHRTAGRPIPEGQPTADTFGFGCIYWPQQVLDSFLADPPMRMVRTGLFNDGVFSGWHRKKFGPVDVDWSVAPQHLHGD